MLTTKQLAAQLGVTPRRVLAICESRGIAPALVAGNAKLWPAATVKDLSVRVNGRPAAKPQAQSHSINARD